jgi:hypothetical protein
LNEDTGFLEVEQRENGKNYTIDYMDFDRDACVNIPNEPLGEL